MEMNFVHEERLTFKCFSEIEGATVTKIAVLRSELVDASLELVFLLYSKKGKFVYCNKRTAEVSIPLDVFGEIFYADEKPETQIVDGVGEIIINVKMRTEIPLCNE